MTLPDLVYPERLGLQQRVFPAYRAAFFDALAQACQAGLCLFAGQPGKDESIEPGGRLSSASYTPARNRHFLSADQPLYICWQSGLIRWLEAWQPGALIVEANSRTESTRRAVAWMHARHRLVIGWGLGAPPIPGMSPGAIFRRWERNSFLQSLDAVISYSKLGAEQYRALGFPPERVFVAPNAAVPRPAGLPSMRPDRSGDSLTVLFVGRLQARKRVDLLLRACASLPHHRRPRLLIVGDGPACPDLTRLAGEIYPDAEFLGALHGEALVPVFAAADLFVLPGTGGLAIQQAMSHALPVIVATGDGTQADLVRSGNGWLIPSDDLGALTDTLSRALSTPSRLREMGLESYRIVSEEINLEKMVEVFITALLKTTAI